MRRIAFLWAPVLGAGLLFACGGTGDRDAGTTAPPRAWPNSASPLIAPSPAAATASAPPPAAPVGPFPGPAIEQVTVEPAIRVRIRSAELNLTVRSEREVRVAGPGALTSQGKVFRYATPLSVARVDGSWLIRDGGGRSVRWRLPELLIECDLGGSLELGGVNYPRRLVLVPRVNPQQQETGRFDVVNHVPLETYLPGVIQKELYGSWPLETFKAQAVAARSYALWEKTIGADRHFDLESTQASQAYTGTATNPKATQAVAETRGQCLTWAGRVLPAFYSSSTGGTGQDALAAFPNRVEDLPPLHARDHGGWDADSPEYRWGPVVRSAATLSRRIAAWGKQESHAVAAMGQLARIEVATRSPLGRPVTFRLTDTSGRSYTLACELFRNACNYSAGGQLPLTKDQKLLSSHVEPVVAGGSVRFPSGRGYGHGVGMSQWGARTMAQAGHSYTAILGFYYPGAVVRVLYR